LNNSAQPLSKNESNIFKNSDILKKKIILSYKLILDFFGMILQDENSGQIERNPEIWKERYIFLNHSYHNYLR
jgi:hypothetical protein